jgi:hypothetical protein
VRFLLSGLLHVFHRRSVPVLTLLLACGAGATLWHMASLSSRLVTAAARQGPSLETEIERRRAVEAELAVARDAVLDSARAPSESLANMRHEIRTGARSARLHAHDRVARRGAAGSGRRPAAVRNALEPPGGRGSSVEGG